MEYTKVNLFGNTKSRGTFDDFFEPAKHKSIQDAYEANDYITGNYVKDKEGTLYIELSHTKNPSCKKYHRLDYQRPLFGIDIGDDRSACKLVDDLFKEYKK